MDDSTTTEKEPCYISALPRELHDMIYHHLWTFTPVIAPFATEHERQNQAGYFVVYGNIPSTRYSDMAQERLPLCWLLTSKDFLAEGIEKIQSCGTWVLDCASQQHPER